MILLLLLAQIEITANVSKDYLNETLSIGDPFEIVVAVQHPADVEISGPFIDSLDPFLIIDQNSRSVEEKGLVSTSYDIRMVAFGTGELQIPPFTFLVQRGETTDTLTSNAIPLKVASIISEDMQDINDIKKAVEFPNFMPLIIAGVLIAGSILGYVVYRYIRKWRSMRVLPRPRPPAWAEAIAALESIPVEEWLLKGLFKRYYYSISETLKRYLERRFEFSAAEQTTTEIVANLKVLRIPQREEFSQFFTRADLVKYAKHIPSHDEMKTAVQVAKDLVMMTRLEETNEAKT
jgi:hypothetical protein